MSDVEDPKSEIAGDSPKTWWRVRTGLPSDFGFPIVDFGLRRKAVRKIIRSESLSVKNLKSKIQNVKWVGSFVLALMFVLVGTRAEAQQPKKVHRLGYLSSFDQSSESARSRGIWLALRELGYIEGQNIAIEYHPN